MSTQIINSRQNQKIKEIILLKQKKYRQLHGLFLIEGIKLVNDAIRLGQNVKLIIGEAECLVHFEGCGVEMLSVSRGIIESLCDSVMPQGVLAVVQLLKSALKPPDGESVCLDGVSDPGNLGTILRICAACGIKDVYLIDCADPYSPKAVRASMGGLFLVKIHIILAEEFERLVDGVPLIMADMEGESVFKFYPPQGFCLVMGSEAHGVSDKIARLCINAVKIPMQTEMESLNVGVSAGIILYQLLKNKFL